MDRELVFAFLVAALCGVVLIASGWWWPAGLDDQAHTSNTERWTWWRIWTPFAPATFVFALLCGWWITEPRSAEPVPKAVMLAALPFAVIFGRAAWRATRALSLPRHHLSIATVGLLRPRIVLSPQFAKALDKDALEAAREHERAHVRHFDPLRLWLAQFASELLWPAPAAAIRLQAWKRALEIARDDEARSRGVAGPDLAAAIVVALRFNQRESAAAAKLADEAFVRERIARLLQPIDLRVSKERRLSTLALALWLAIPLALLIGMKFGEMVIGTLLIKA